MLRLKKILSQLERPDGEKTRIIRVMVLIFESSEVPETFLGSTWITVDFIKMVNIFFKCIETIM